MKLVPGYSFTVSARAKMDFVLGNTYRIYHISPLPDGVEYIFQSRHGNIKAHFESTEHAEALINKMSGKSDVQK